MTRTVFGLTGNGDTTGYPDMDGWPLSRGNSHDAIDRYSRINATGRYAYPIEAIDAGFNIPYILFRFTDAYGGRIVNAPTVTMKMPGNFNITGFSDYARTENIFATSSDIYNQITDSAVAMKQNDVRTENAGGDNSGLQKAIDKIAQVGVSAAEAFQYSWKRAFANLEGWGASAGLSNIGQYEFMNRQAVNPMAQLLYRGPQMRKYQLPFSMHPKSSADSENIQKILSIFRVASSPSVPNTSGTAIAGINIGAGNAFTFGYPHLTQFDILFVKPTNAVQTIFRSKLCVIESVSADYGSQKMTFFEDGKPTEIALTLQLTEITPRTLGDAYSENSTDITLR